MKLTTFFIAVIILSAATIANAKAEYFDGKVESVDTNAQTISVIGKKTKELVTYSYADDVTFKNAEGKTRELTSIDKGDNVRLKLEAAK